MSTTQAAKEKEKKKTQCKVPNGLSLFAPPSNLEMRVIFDSVHPCRAVIQIGCIICFVLMFIVGMIVRSACSLLYALIISHDCTFWYVYLDMDWT